MYRYSFLGFIAAYRVYRCAKNFSSHSLQIQRKSKLFSRHNNNNLCKIILFTQNFLFLTFLIASFLWQNIKQAFFLCFTTYRAFDVFAIRFDYRNFRVEYTDTLFASFYFILVLLRSLIYRSINQWQGVKLYIKKTFSLRLCVFVFLFRFAALIRLDPHQYFAHLNTLTHRQCHYSPVHRYKQSLRFCTFSFDFFFNVSHVSFVKCA